jgi:hypothetical protein
VKTARPDHRSDRAIAILEEQAARIERAVDDLRQVLADIRQQTASEEDRP